MADTEDTWPRPKYNVGKPKHLHAIGVVSMAFNAFERNMHTLYRFHLDKKKVPQAVTDFTFFGLQEHQRLEALRIAFDCYERDSKVKAALENLIEYFDWASQVRNHLLHSQFYPAPFEGEHTIDLIKRRSRKSRDSAYLQFDLAELRSFADKVYEGNRQAAGLYLFLRQRRVPPHKWSTSVQRHGREPLPGKLEIPKPPATADRPFDPRPPLLRPA